MARIPYPDPQAADPKVTEALAALPPANVFRMAAHAQTLLRPWLRFGGAILSRLELDPVLRELAILQVAQSAGAEYEWIQHVAIGRAVGVSDEQIAALERGDLDDPALGAAGLAVVRFTDQLVRVERPDDEVFDELRRHLSDREVVELIFTAGNYLLLARMMTALELDLDEPMGDRLIADARPRA